MKSNVISKEGAKLCRDVMHSAMDRVRKTSSRLGCNSHFHALDALAMVEREFEREIVARCDGAGTNRQSSGGGIGIHSGFRPRIPE